MHKTRAVLKLVWPSILLQFARDRVATAGETMTVSRLWSRVNSVNNTIKCLKKLIGSLGHHQNLTHCWHHGTVTHTHSHAHTHNKTTNGWCLTSRPYQYNNNLVPSYLRLVCRSLTVWSIHSWWSLVVRTPVTVQSHGILGQTDDHIRPSVRLRWVILLWNM